MLISVPLSGQNEGYSIAEIKLQGLFIEANKHKLLGRFEKAREILLEIYREDRNNAVVNYELAKNSSSLELTEDVDKYIKRAIRLQPEQEYYYRFYIDFLHRLTRNAELIQLYEQTIERFPDKPRYYLGLAEEHAKLGNLELAIDILNKLEGKRGIEEKVVQQKFDWFVYLEEHDKALSELEKLHKSKPRNVRYLNNIGSYLVQRNQIDHALDYFNQAIKIDPKNERAISSLARLTTNSSPDDSPFSKLHILITNPDITLDEKILTLVPYVEKLDPNSENNSAFMKILDQLVALHPKEAKAYAIYGDAGSQIGDIPLAIEKYKETINLNHTVFTVWEQLLYSISEIKDFDDLRQTAQSALDYYPNQSICYFFLGQAEWALGNFTKADEALEEASLMSYGNHQLLSQIHSLWAQNDLALQNSFKALEHINKSIEFVESPGPGLYEIRGDIHLILSNLPKEELFMRALQVSELKKKAVEDWEMAVEKGGDKARLEQKINQSMRIE